MTDPTDRPGPGPEPQSAPESPEDISQAPCPGCHRMRARDTARCPHCGLLLAGELAAHLRHIDDELRGLAAAMAYPPSSSQAYFSATPAQLTQRYQSLLAERGNVLQALYTGAPAVQATGTPEQSPPNQTPPAQPISDWTQQHDAARYQAEAALQYDAAGYQAGQYASGPYPYVRQQTTAQYPVTAPLGYSEPSTRPETSPRVVQNTLLVLGGLLLGAEGITFTVLAWDSMGIAERSVVLGIATVILLAAPVVLLRQRLRATAETVVVLGLLFLALDGYAAWRTVLADGAVNGFGYSAALVTIVAIVGLCYRTVAPAGPSPLVAPPLVAVTVMHAVPPLVALGISETVLSFAAACLFIAAVDVTLLARMGQVSATAVNGGEGPSGPMHPTPRTAGKLGYPVRAICVSGATLASVSGVVTGLAEVSTVASTERALAGAGLVLGFAVIIGISGWFSRGEVWSALSAALAPLLLAWDAALLVQRFSSESSLVAVTSAGLGLLCAAITVLLPRRLRTGATIGTAAILILTAVPVTVWALLAAWGPVGRTDRAPWGDVSDIGIRMLCALVLICVAGALLQWGAQAGNAGVDDTRPDKAGAEAAVGPALLAIAVFTTTIGPLSAAPLALLVTLPLLGAAMVTGMGLLDTGITREGTFAGGLLLSANALSRGVDTTTGSIATLIAIVALYLLVAAFTASSGVRVISTTVASVSLLTLSAPITAALDGGEILAGYLILLGVMVLLGTASVIAVAGGKQAQPASVTMEVTGGVGGFVALMFTLQDRLGAAVVATALTAALAALALRESRRSAVWWSMAVGVVSVALWLRAAELTAVEAYTLPLALALLVIGVIAQYRKPDRPSWVTFGPGLLLGTGPTLVLVLFGPPDPLRALLLGSAAVAITTIGAFTDRQAPFVLGAIAVAAVALRVGTPLLPELTAQLPVWMPLAVGGALLLAVGAGYERGRRDIRRLVGVIRRMD